jgi:hypothetical protein
LSEKSGLKLYQDHTVLKGIIKTGSMTGVIAPVGTGDDPVCIH